MTDSVPLKISTDPGDAKTALTILPTGEFVVVGIEGEDDC